MSIYSGLISGGTTMAAEGEGSNGGGGYATTVRPERERPATDTTTHAGAASPSAHARAYDYALTYAHARAYVSLAMKASGLLALLLSTVVLLGGYVQSLGKKEFFCITVISAIQAAGIFKHWENNLQYLMDFIGTTNCLLDKLIILTTNFSVKGLFIACLSILVSPFLAVALCIQLIYLLGPFACAAVSSWRMAKLNHGSTSRDRTDSMANMMAALNMFYSLIIFQGAMFGVLLLTIGVGRRVVASHLHALEQLLEEWGKEAIHRYLDHISAKCRKDPLSVKGTDMIKYAAELLDSESQQDYLHGARLLSAFLKKGEDVRWLLLPSTHRIKKLVGSLWISSSNSSLDENTEIRELAATIVAGLAAHVDVARYPGALRYISSLLQEETTQTHWNNSKLAASDPQPPQQLGPLEILRQPKEEQMKNLTRGEEKRQWRLMRDQKRLGTSQDRRRQNSEGRTTTSNELILQGLTILERLASNRDNRRLICSTPGLLPKITAPLYSETLIQDVKTKAWADIVTKCLKVLYQLIRAPGWTSRMLRHEISSDDQALSNLKSILDQGNEAEHQELKLRAMEILTELALDLSINLTQETKKVLVTKQLQLFLLANGDDEESAAIAGRAMVSLSTNSESNSALIMSAQNDITGRRLTEILDDKNNNITQRTIAAEIMANLCAHCNADNNMMEILPKVLRKIMSIKTKSQERKISAGQNNPALGDEENQANSVSINTNISKQGDHTEIEEISDQEREEHEAFLSLAQVICDKMDSADLDVAIQSAVDQNNAGSNEQRREAFVDKLKTIIDDNCHPAADSLRIVMLCGRIAESTMRCQEYVEHLRNKGFKSSLSEASKTMSELESCMLFVGTDFGLKKTVRPLFSEIEKSFGQI